MVRQVAGGGRVVEQGVVWGSITCIVGTMNTMNETGDTMFTFARMGTGTKIHARVGQSTTQCSHSGQRRRSYLMDVDPKHVTDANLCRSCFGDRSAAQVIATQAGGVEDAHD